MKNTIADFFELEKRGVTFFSETVAGTTTFLTMSYIIFVQPALLSITGADFGSVMVATCISSAIATFAMAYLANYPIALAPAMGHNIFFVFTVCGPVATGAMGFKWQEGLAAVFLSGLLFLLLSFFSFREKIIESIPLSLRQGLAVGIGLMIALLGLEWGGIIVDAPGVLVGFGDVGSAPFLVTVFGVFLIAILTTLKVRGAILLALIGTTVAALFAGVTSFKGFVAMPPSLEPTLFKIDIAGLITHPSFWTAIIIFFVLDLFDTIGTLMGLSASAGLLDEKGNLPKAEKALTADALGTAVGALLGTSTVTSYVESSAGISAGGRTGFSSVITGLFFLMAIFFAPLVETIGGGYDAGGGVTLYPIIAPVLISVGAMLVPVAGEIDWKSPSESFPAYLTMIITPLTLSITEGISAGFICYVILKTADGKFKELSPVTIIIALLFVGRYWLL